MPQIAAYQKSLPSNVQLITYCIDGTDYFDEMVEILENADYTGITLVKGDGDLHSLYTELMYVPTTVFVDKEGNICAEPIIGASEDVAYTYQSVIDSILYG